LPVGLGRNMGSSGGGAFCEFGGGLLLYSIRGWAFSVALRVAVLALEPRWAILLELWEKWNASTAGCIVLTKTGLFVLRVFLFAPPPLACWPPAAPREWFFL